MKHVKLDNMREATITDEAYAQILAIVDNAKLCGRCQQPYRTDNPQVAQNLCLACFQKKYQHKGLTYVGVYSTNKEGDVTHQFTDARGYISLTSTFSENDPY